MVPADRVSVGWPVVCEVNSSTQRVSVSIWGRLAHGPEMTLAVTECFILQCHNCLGSSTGPRSWKAPGSILTATTTNESDVFTAGM